MVVGRGGGGSYTWRIIRNYYFKLLQKNTSSIGKVIYRKTIYTKLKVKKVHTESNLNINFR